MLSPSASGRVSFPKNIRGGGLGLEKNKLGSATAPEAAPSIGPLRRGGKLRPRQVLPVDLMPSSCALSRPSWPWFPHLYTEVYFALTIGPQCSLTSATLGWHLISQVPGRDMYDGLVQLGHTRYSCSPEKSKSLLRRAHPRHRGHWYPLPTCSGGMERAKGFESRSWGAETSLSH